MIPGASNQNFNLLLQAISEVKTMLIGLDERVRMLEQTTISQSVTAAQKLDAAFRRLDEHATKLEILRSDIDSKVTERIRITDELDRRLAKAESITAIAKWLAGFLVMLIVALLWAIFTNQAQVIFK